MLDTPEEADFNQITREMPETRTRPAEFNSADGFPFPPEGLIVSDEKHIRFLHRAQLNGESWENILTMGLNVKGILQSVATKCPEDASLAQTSYQRRQSLDKQVLVIEFPREEYEQYAQRLRSKGDYTSRPEDSFLKVDTEGKEPRQYLPAKYIKGYIERESGRFVPNPNYAG